ncbi:TetR/AcrR family transcriptional regulator [Tropicimonas sp. IMCC34043]|uniref:acrylate utilization transcriptional regulator AcuR n=1 Tax=Tropicimonas sp. IMCC34043 TaxID=2248760 RepID=UPI000E271ADC|nr:TetR/AcrR family transcriptional regulator [Tropicimonas sp. IMCC34043]
MDRTQDPRDDTQDAPRRRGRPPRAPAEAETRQRLIRSGLEQLTEKGFSAVGIDEILRHAGVPKGGFYHYFPTKAAFGRELVATYRVYFAARLDRFLLDGSMDPLDRLRAFAQDAEAGMARHGFRRGCLIGTLGQEMGALPEDFRADLIAVLEDWQARTAACLAAAQAAGQIGAQHDPVQLAAFFWTGWEGAVLRAKLERRPDPLRRFADGFFQLLELYGDRP